MLFDDVRDVIVETVGCEAAAVTPEALEEKLDIEIDDAELDQFKTVNDLVSYLETKVQ